MRNGTILPVTENVTYLGVYARSDTDSADLLMTHPKFYRSFSYVNILSNATDEVLAVHVVVCW